MRFEWDPAKSAANLEKHGIDFVAAQEVWQDGNRFKSRSRYVEEPRHTVVGRVGPRLWTVVVTIRGARIRIISARRARGHEAAAYLRGRVRPPLR